jgi:hypothetical protein
MIIKKFDDMTGSGQISTSAAIIFETKGWFVTPTHINLAFALVVNDNGRFGWIMVNSQLLAWKFVGERRVNALIDGTKRYQFNGEIKKTDTAVVGDTVYCLESFHIFVEEDFLAELARSQSAKLRLGGTDFDVPSELISDLKDLIKESATL